MKFPSKQAETYYKKGLLAGLNVLWGLHDTLEGDLIRIERRFSDGELQKMLDRETK